MIERWGISNKLSFAPQKTVVVMFHNKRKLPKLRQLKFKNTSLPFSDEVKYLGVTLDSRLRYDRHISEKVKKARGLLYKVNNSIGKLWGPLPSLMRWAYVGMVRPVLTYASILWGEAAQKASNIKKFDRLQRLAMNGFTSTIRSTPTRGLEVLYNIPPIHIQIIKLSLASLPRCTLRNPKLWDGIGNCRTGHIKFWTGLHRRTGAWTKWCWTFAR